MTLGDLRYAITMIDEPDDTPVLLRSQNHEGCYVYAHCASPADFDEKFGGEIVDSDRSDEKDPRNRILKRFVAVCVE